MDDYGKSPDSKKKKAKRESHDNQQSAGTDNEKFDKLDKVYNEMKSKNKKLKKEL